MGRVLLVEDHRETAHVLQRVLQRSGFEVMVAPDAATARSLAQRKPFDMLISDLGLPDTDGWTLRQQLEPMGSITSIALSGFGSAEDRQRSRKAGFDVHLLKPARIQDLREAIAFLMA